MENEYDIPPVSPLRQALLDGKPITESLEQEEWGPAYTLMRSSHYTPLGVADRFASWYEARTTQFDLGICDALIPTLEETEQLVQLFQAGKYEDIAKALDAKAAVAKATLIQEDEDFAQYTAQNPTEFAEYQNLNQLRKGAAQHYSSELARAIAKQKDQTRYGAKKKEYERRRGQFSQIYSFLNSSRTVLRGEYIEE